MRAIKENQFEARGDATDRAARMNVGVTSYYRLSDDPPHTTLLPDSRFYTYASFDKGKAYGMEIKADVPQIADLGLSAYLNYALGRVWFYNPIVAGFTTEAAHLTETEPVPGADGPDAYAHVRADLSARSNATLGRGGARIRKRHARRSWRRRP